MGCRCGKCLLTLAFLALAAETKEQKVKVEE